MSDDPYEYREAMERAEMAMDDAVEEFREENERLRALNEELLKVLAEYAVLGHGKCTIGKPLAEMARAAIAKALGKDTGGK